MTESYGVDFGDIRAAFAAGDVVAALDVASLFRREELDRMAPYLRGHLEAASGVELHDHHIWYTSAVRRVIRQLFGAPRAEVHSPFWYPERYPTQDGGYIETAPVKPHTVYRYKDTKFEVYTPRIASHAHNTVVQFDNEDMNRLYEEMRQMYHYVLDDTGVLTSDDNSNTMNFSSGFGYVDLTNGNYSRYTEELYRRMAGALGWNIQFI